MYLYEKYLEDIDALSDDRIAELRAYHEETISLVKYYQTITVKPLSSGMGI